MGFQVFRFDDVGVLGLHRELHSSARPGIRILIDVYWLLINEFSSSFIYRFSQFRASNTYTKRIRLLQLECSDLRIRILLLELLGVEDDLGFGVDGLGLIRC